MYRSIADKILDRIPHNRRVKKNWKARDEEGKGKPHNIN